VSQQTSDNADVAVLSRPHKGDVCVAVATQLAGRQHQHHKRQSTTGGVITERLKVRRHVVFNKFERKKKKKKKKKKRGRLRELNLEKYPMTESNCRLIDPNNT
jgi:hypothetical protein